MSVKVIYDAIIRSITQELNPDYLYVVDESAKHSRATPAHPETHFNIVIVSDVFKDLSRVRRQQLVFTILEKLFESGLHALTQSTFTREEWSKNPKVMTSPNCAGHKS